MDEITLIEPQQKYADDIWESRQEILEYDVENEDQFAGCLSLDVSKSARVCKNGRVKILLLYDGFFSFAVARQIVFLFS